MIESTPPAQSNVARTIFYNVVTFFVLFNLLYWAIPTVSALSRLYGHVRLLVANMPPGISGLQAARWVREHWSGTGLPPADYHSHIGWRRVSWARDGYHIEGPYLQRRTINIGTSGRAKVYFFGGSTMWGTGVPDAATVPSQFAAKTGFHSENFGEPGYTAHQSLLLLIQVLQAGHRPDLVVFYDGVNEVWVKCRSELNAGSHEREQQFRTILRRSFLADSFSHYFAPLFAVAANVNRELDRTTRGEDYDCHRNPQKAQAIADNMVKDWEFARKLVEWHGGKFIALLQPVVHFSRTPIDHLEIGAFIERLRPGYETVYPMLRERVMRTGGDFHDLVSVVDGSERVYTDFCHLTPTGNARVAERIAEIVAPLGLAR
jgi:lysophospholipase L1-like esterase